MFSLIDSNTMSQIENGLIVRRNQFIQATSWMLNLLILVVVVIGFATFLYVQYTTTAEEEAVEKHIPFEPIPWLSATRNVRMEEYGKQLKPYDTSEAQVGYGVPGSFDGFSSADVR
jgi:glucan phosphoethanolaminetransferase (alkaline phosphatase superfamily)